MTSDLIARLQEATGPDRKLDVEIHVLVVDFSTDHLWDVIEQIGVKGSGWTPSADEWPLYTASLDAALTLLPPEATWSMSKWISGKDTTVFWVDVHTHEESQARHPMAAVAVCIAAFKVRAFETVE